MRTDMLVGADQGRNFPWGLRELGSGEKVSGTESGWWDGSLAPWREHRMVWGTSAAHGHGCLAAR